MKYSSIRLGPLPADEINRLLDADLEDGNVFVSKAAHEHIAVDHPDDYEIIRRHFVECISNPTYVGQDLRHADSFIMIKRLPGPDRNILVAIGLELNKYGGYNLKSAYRISEHDVEIRRRKGILKYVALRAK